MADSIAAGPDPALLDEMSHLTADFVVHRGRANADPEVLDRLVRLVDREGIDIVAQMWASAPSTTLPGALWRMYLLREWVRSAPELFALHYRLGCSTAEFSHVVTGISSPPGPQDAEALADQVLSGVFEGDLGVALERAGAFCRVVAVGATFDADTVDLGGSLVASKGGNARSDINAQSLVVNAAVLNVTAQELEQAADLWRRRRLD